MPRSQRRQLSGKPALAGAQLVVVCQKLWKEHDLSRLFDHCTIDPDNRLVWRANKRRLDAEAIRDGMLAVSGELDLNRPAGSLVGRKIGDGSPDEVRANPDVISAYLGTVH